MTISHEAEQGRTHSTDSPTQSPDRSTISSRGRPRTVSRDVLEEAASELFLEQGYAHTTAAQIASRAGVSRGTFFNTFATKADVFWGDFDDVIAQLPGELAASAKHLSAIEAITGVLMSHAEVFGSDRVPWVLTQFEAIGRPAEVRGAAAERLGILAEMLVGFVRERDAASISAAEATTRVYTLLGAALSAIQSWALAGASRGTLDTHLRASLVVSGHLIDRSAS